MQNKLKDKKKEFRKKQYILRKNLFSTTTNIFNEHLFEIFFEKINLQNINVVSSFYSINTEISTIELNNYIIKKNKILCLPVILNKNSHLVFRKFTNDMKMITGYMNIKEPPNTSEIHVPELLFIPCLAFDKFGYRLGYGC